MRARRVWTGVVLLVFALALAGCDRFYPLTARIRWTGSNEGPIPFTVRFTSAGSSGGVVSRTWDFGDPASGADNASAAVAPSHTYAAHGAYLVTLTVFSDDGRSNHATAVIVATNPPPVPVLAASPAQGPAPLPVVFDLHGSYDPAGVTPAPSGSIVSFRLDFGDGSAPALGADVSAPVFHTYAAPGVYAASLVVVDDDGASATASQRIVVEGIVASLASPGPDPAGMAYGNSSLWVSDATTHWVYRLRPSDGTVLGSFAAPGAHVASSAPEGKGIVPDPVPAGVPAGLAWQDGALWVACVSDGTLYKVNPYLPATDPNHVVASLQSLEFKATGLAYGAGALWVGDVGRGRIFKVDPWTGSVLASFAAPSAPPAPLGAKGVVAVAPVGLAWADGSLWVTAGATLVRMDPATGRILDAVAAPGPTPVGLAFDGVYLWACDPNGTAPGRLDRLVVQ